MERFSSSSDQIEQVPQFAALPAGIQIRNIPATSISFNTVATIRGTVAVKR
jgi:hypothetical protein